MASAVVWRSCGGRVAVVWRSCDGSPAAGGVPSDGLSPALRPPCACLAPAVASIRAPTHPPLGGLERALGLAIPAGVKDARLTAWWRRLPTRDLCRHLIGAGE